MARCQFLDKPITRDLWDQINALDLPTKVRALVSFLQDRNNEPALPMEIPGFYWSTALYANGIFRKWKLPLRIAWIERNNLLQSQKRSLRLFQVETVEHVTRHPLRGGRSFKINGRYRISDNGSIEISLWTPTSRGKGGALRQIFVARNPKKSRLSWMAKEKEIVIELRSS